MASIGASMYADAMPAFVDGSDDPHTQTDDAQARLSASADVSASVAVLRVAWVIIIGSLIILWLLGRSFR